MALPVYAEAMTWKDRDRAGRGVLPTCPPHHGAPDCCWVLSSSERGGMASSLLSLLFGGKNREGQTECLPPSQPSVLELVQHR